MKRTHVMHKRDNRRSFSYYGGGANPNDRRPILTWIKEGAANSPTHVMILDGERVARVEPVGWPEFDVSRGDYYQRHDAIIEAGPRKGTRKAFPDDADSARLFCEQCFSLNEQNERNAPRTSNGGAT